MTGLAHPTSLSEASQTPKALWSDEDNLWLPVARTDARARGLFQRHYSYQHSHRLWKPAAIVPPGEALVLITARADALFAWSLHIEQIGGDRPERLNCAIFRNESAVLSSLLIRQAEAWGLRKWPDIKIHYTYVAPTKIKSPNPGYCFKQAGYRTGRTTPKGLVELVKEFPDASGNRPDDSDNSGGRKDVRPFV